MLASFKIFSNTLNLILHINFKLSHYTFPSCIRFYQIEYFFKALRLVCVIDHLKKTHCVRLSVILIYVTLNIFASILLKFIFLVMIKTK